MLKRTRPSRAVSLIEIMISVTLIGLSMSMVVALLPSSKLSAKLSRQRTQAGNIAQGYLEEHRANLGEIHAGPLSTVNLEDTEFKPNVTTETIGQAIKVRVTVTWSHGDSTRSVFREQIFSELPR
jgi:type II secretory pathway pseudopilin PulG